MFISHLLFIDSFRAVENNFKGGAVLSIKLCPNRKYVLFTSSSSFWFTKANDDKQIIISECAIQQKYITEEGYISNSGWVDSNTIFLLTTNGSILVYNVQNFAQITLKNIIKHPSGKFITTADSYSSFIIAGDTEGNVLILSVETCESFVRPIAPLAIKMLRISRHYGFIRTGDGSLFSFDIKPEILQNPDYDFHLTDLKFKARSIVTSKSTNLAAACSTTGTILVTNFKTTRILETHKRVISIIFGPDSTLFAISQGFIGILFSMQPSFRWYERRELIESCLFTVSKTQIIASNDTDFFVAPLIYTSSNSYYPICYTMNEIYEIHSSKENTIISIKHERPDFIRHIKHCVSNGTTVAATGNGEIGLLDLKTNKWSHPSHPSLKSVKGVVWWCDHIVCAVPNVKMHEFSIKIMSCSNDKVATTRIVKLPGCPNSMRCDNKSLVVSLATSVYVIRNDTEEVRKIDTPATFSDIDTGTGRIFSLMRGRKLQCENSEVLSDVSSFFVDKESGVIIAHSDGRILAGDTKHCRFRQVCTTGNKLFGGIIPGAFMILCYDDQKTELPPSGEIYSYLSDVFAANVDNTERATFLILPHLSKSYANDAIAVGLETALKNGKAKSVLSFIRAKPAVFSLPPNRRAKTSDIFAHLIGCEVVRQTENDNYLSFVVKREPIKADISPLCEEIKKEEGYVAAACCALMLMKQYHPTIEVIESCLLILNLPFPKSSNTISDNVLELLRENLSSVLSDVCYDLMLKLKPEFALRVSEKANVSLSDCLMSKSEPNDLPVIDIISSFASKLTDNSINDKTLEKLSEEFEKCKWNIWSFLTLLVKGNTNEAMKILDKAKCAVVIPIIKKSQYAHLIDL